MRQKYFKVSLVILTVVLLPQMTNVSSHTRNYEAKYVKSNVPLWKQRACEKSQRYKANSHYICDDTGDVKCLPGWQGDLCQVPMCRRGCDPMNGYCQRPGECRCHIGYTGDLCDKCIPLPGCQHGDCTKPFECICHPGWDGLFCTEPTCRQGCHNTRGYCESPGECRCRLGWAGRNCSDCSVLPGCQHGTCTKPLECQCLAGYTGFLCQTPVCKTECHKQYGYCKRPGECRCKIGWTGANCDKCFPYPGCVNGDCEKPWECNCKPGWGGMLCDEKLTYCKEHPNLCENKAKCISLTKEDGSYRCQCAQGYLGKNCEIIDEFLLTSVAIPHITPPSITEWIEDQQQDEKEEESKESNSSAVNTELPTTNDLKVPNNDLIKFKINATQEEIKDLNTLSVLSIWQDKNFTEDSKISNNLEKIIKVNNTRPENSEVKQDHVMNLTIDKNTKNKTEQLLTTETLVEPTASSESLKTSTAPMANTATTHIITNSTKAFVGMGSTAAPQVVVPSTISPLSKLDEEENLHNMPLNQTQMDKKLLNKADGDKNGDDDEDDDDDDEECTDDNDDECEYVDEDDEDDDDDSGF